MLPPVRTSDTCGLLKAFFPILPRPPELPPCCSSRRTGFGRVVIYALSREFTQRDSACICGGAGPMRLRIFAWFMARFGNKADRYLAPYKSELFAEVSGTVLEIGPGAGANRRYF